MGIKAHVLSKYQVEYGSSFFADSFESMIQRMADEPAYETIVEWVDENHMTYELDKSLLTDLSEDEQIDGDLREFARQLIESGDPLNQYVRVELW